MAKELEIKLSLSETHVAKAWEWLSNRPEAELLEPRDLRNVYFDTPDGQLNQHKVALRVRQTGDGFIQTLKTQGEFVDGVHRRNEWEWSIPGAELQKNLLADLPALQTTDLNALVPMFETNFMRRIVMFTVEGAVIEVAFDQGDILSGSQRQPLNEVEFELKDGEPGALIQWARRMAEAVPVFLNTVSKAEQGYHLSGVESLMPRVSGVLSVHEFLTLLSACWLRGQPFPQTGIDVSQLRTLARQSRVIEAFDVVMEQLLTGSPIDALTFGGDLGRVQLAIADAKLS